MILAHIPSGGLFYIVHTDYFTESIQTFYFGLTPGLRIRDFMLNEK